MNMHSASDEALSAYSTGRWLFSWIEWQNEEGAPKGEPWYSYIVWAVAYSVAVLGFVVASSPFSGSRTSRFNWSPYSLSYYVAGMWIFCGIIGHTPFYTNFFHFKIDEPASMLMPCFWSSLTTLLGADLLHTTTQRGLRWAAAHKVESDNPRLAWTQRRLLWAYEVTRTKFKISFGRSFSEAALSSMAISCLCCMLHASEIVGTSRLWELVTQHQRRAMPKYAHALHLGSVPEWLCSPIFGVWLSLMAILLVDHWFERTSSLRGLFWDDGMSLRPGDTLHTQLRPRPISRVPTPHLPLAADELARLLKQGSSALSGDEAEGPSAPAIAPRNKRPMAGWYEPLLTQTAVDMFIHMNLFSGRFDMRHLLATQLIGGRAPCSNMETPVEGNPGDPFFHDHSGEGDAARREMWLDFVADVGDGFDSSYSIARLLAQPSLKLPLPPRSRTTGEAVLPRGQLLLIGGDLAYPRPTPDNFEQRFLRVFEDAMPPPRGVPPFDQEFPLIDAKEKQRLPVTDPPPMAYVVPGNHDWFDGLSCFLRYIIYRSHLGGWLLPQRKSYFALKLPHEWWVFGLDNGLEGEIDPQQAAYFGRLAKTLPAQATVIVVTHDPNWVLDAYHGTAPTDEPAAPKHKGRTGKLLEYLMETSLKGKVRLRLAGDIHNYMRHEPLEQPHGRASESAAPPPPALVVAGGGGAFLHPTHMIGHEPLTASGTGGTKYTRAATYPASDVSAAISHQILLKFRQRNWGFDLIGGMAYCILASPLFHTCDLTSTAAIDSQSAASTLGSFLSDTFYVAAPRILTSSSLAFLAFVAFFSICVCSVDHDKLGVRLWLGGAHAAAHLYSAAAVTVFIDYLIAVLRVYGNLGQGGLDLQWDLFTKGDAATTIAHLGNWTNGVVPKVLRASMLLADSAQTQSILREQLCDTTSSRDHLLLGHPSHPAFAPDTLAIFYWLLRMAWYWCLACPVVSFVFSLYLWLSVRYLGIHWNEGFSSLQHTGYKNFVRLRVRSDGDLELFAVGVDKCPSRWVLDGNHVQEAEEAEAEAEAQAVGAGGGGPERPAYRWRNPSRWIEQRSAREARRRRRRGLTAELQARVVDHFLVRKR